MTTAVAVDYIRTVNTLCEELLHSHRDVLRRKNIVRKQDLIQTIKLDLDKLTHALYEVRENSAASVLQTFFSGALVDTESVVGKLTDGNIYHVGYEVHEPLDLVLYGIDHWIENSRRNLGAEMRVSNYLRFPASEAFQRRVGACTEIMRIWLEVNGRELMLELFDIERPVNHHLAGAPKAAHRNFHGLFRQDHRASGHDQRILDLFAADEIWHYALHVKHSEDVWRFHNEWRELASRDPDFFVPYAEPVHNHHDCSFHTKVIRNAGNTEGRMELEFVTHCAR